MASLAPTAAPQTPGIAHRVAWFAALAHLEPVGLRGWKEELETLQENGQSQRIRFATCGDFVPRYADFAVKLALARPVHSTTNGPWKR